MTPPETPAGENKTRIICVISVKGGVGKTTVASNLGVLMSSAYNLKTLIIDCDYDMPCLGFHLNLIDPDITLHDALGGRFPLDSAIHVHTESGLNAILGSLSSEPINAGEMENAIKQLSGKYDLILLDTTPSLDSNLKNIISLSDEVLLISSPDFPSISGSLKAIKEAAECGIKVRGVVLNRVRKKRYELDLQEIEETLGTKVISSIPEDPKVYEALSQKKPVFLYAPNSSSGKELKKLAGILIENPAPKKIKPSRIKALALRINKTANYPLFK
jgi:pilus assembly protein CpaE